MTVKPIVTLFESYGAGAQYVGPLVADALDVPWLQQACSSEDLEFVEREGERASGPPGRLGRFLMALGVASGSRDYSTAVFDDEGAEVTPEGNSEDVVARVEDGGVLLGRNATVILADHPQAIHVKLVGREESRLEFVMIDEGLSRPAAERRMEREDRMRAEMALRLFGWDPREPHHFDLILDTGRLSIDTVVDLIVAAARARMASLQA